MLRRRTKQKWNTSSRYLRSLFLPALIFALFLTFFLIGTANTSQTSAKESRQVLENALQKAIVQCYAIEGMYPPNVAYLKDHYGIQVDDKRFIVHYEAFASNILPTLAVIER